MVPGLGPARTRALLLRFGSASAARRASVAQLQQVPHIGAELAGEIARSLPSIDIEPELALLQRHQVELLPLGNPAYPQSLATIPDPPPLLFLRGTLTPADERAVALVGSRHCSTYGRKVAERLASGLARAGVTVVSGLARGIDGIAHRAAMQAGGRTLAVLAGGLARIYPPEHRDLADEVTRAGALITESTMEQDPVGGLFPARNRLISGLSGVIVIIEAAEKSGALHTANHAGEQGRTVMAVPGPIDSETSGGCHSLLRNGAVLCRGVDDILEELHGVSGMVQQAAASLPSPASVSPTEAPKPASVSAPERPKPAPPPIPAGPPPGLDDNQRRIWELLGEGTRSVDELAQQLALPIAPLNGTLTLLEMKKVIRRLPGNRYERC
jgi:DNA processing protein